MSDIDVACENPGCSLAWAHSGPCTSNEEVPAAFPEPVAWLLQSRTKIDYEGQTPEQWTTEDWADKRKWRDQWLADPRGDELQAVPLYTSPPDSEIRALREALRWIASGTTVQFYHELGHCSWCNSQEAEHAKGCPIAVARAVILKED